jgi:hypothetical protein
MHIAVYKCPPKLTVDMVTEAVRFYASTLMNRQLVKNLTVKVFFKDEGVDGLCNTDDDLAKPREFALQINPKRSLKAILTALAHEMVHVKQYATGESKQYERTPYVTKFRGVMVNTSTTDYWDLPWEIDAYGRELGLYVRFMEHWKNVKTKADKT